MREMKLSTTIFLWVLAVVITLASVVYQRMTGPTYPIRGELEIEGNTISYKLLRTYENTSDAEMKIVTENADISGRLKYRRYKSHDQWHTLELPRRGDTLLISLPRQPAAGKIMYELTLIDSAGREYPLQDEPTIIRFKGPVPTWVLIPHIILMFGAMLLSTRTGLDALLKGTLSYRYAVITTIVMFVGGLIMGPLVQKYAFDALWTGWPFGHDLTDNKTLVAFVFWLIALWRARRFPDGRIWIIVASLVTLVIFLIPHSVLGSEIDYTQMEMVKE